MSLADKKAYLKDVQTIIEEYVTAAEASRILGSISDVLINYNMEFVARNDDSDSRELLKYFLDAKKIQGCSESTINRYSYLLTRLKKDTGVPYSRMTIYHIRDYFISEQERGISAATLDGYRSAYNSFFGWLQRENLLQENPIANLSQIRKPKVMRKPFAAVELMKISEAARNPRDRAIIAFLNATGCRISEVCAANQEDIDWPHMRLKVFGKGAKERTVFIDEVTKELLERYLIRRKDANPALFTGKGAVRLKPGGVRRMLKQIEKAAGVENVHPHRFRRTLATRLINNGMPIQEVAAVLGHEKIDTTMTYIYIDVERVADAYKKYSTR